MENSRPQKHIHLVNTKGELVQCTIKTPTIKRKSEYRQIERYNNAQASKYNEIETLFREKNGQLVRAKAEGDEVMAGLLEKQIANDTEALAFMDTEAFERQVKQVQLIVNVPSGEEIDWQDQDTNEFDKATLFFFGIALPNLLS